MKLFTLTALSFVSASLLHAESAKNVLLICVDDLRPELGCYGVTHMHTPHIDALAARSILFKHHYVQAPTCGASRYTLLTAQYGPAGNNALMALAKNREKQASTTIPTMPEWFKQHGYTTCSVGKVSHHPGGLGGSDWNDPKHLEMPQSWDLTLMPSGKWQHPRGAMHGLANGEIRIKASDMDVFQATAGDDSTYPDGLITHTAQQQLKSLTKKQKPFFLAVGFIRPHLPLGAPANYVELYTETEFPPIAHPNKPKGVSTWHGSGEFMKYNNWGKDPRKDSQYADEVRRHYAACVSYTDAQVGKLLATLKETGADKNTTIVLWGDHGWHLGEHAIWGKHSLFEESLHAPLLIASPDRQMSSGSTDIVVETIDIFPTLCALTKLPTPDNVDGKSLVQLARSPHKNDLFAVSYTARAATIRSSTHRLVAHKNGALELYDYTANDRGSINCAEQQAEIAQSLLITLKDRLPRYHFK